MTLPNSDGSHPLCTGIMNSARDRATEDVASSWEEEEMVSAFLARESWLGLLPQALKKLIRKERLVHTGTLRKKLNLN